MSDADRAGNIRFYLISFAAVAGLGMAGKFLFLPYALVPLFMIPTAKWKVTYLVFAAIATMIFAFPVVVNLEKSLDWFGNLFLHSGLWGKGERTVVDPTSAAAAVRTMYRIDKSLFWLLGLSSLLAIAMLIRSRLRKRESPDVSVMTLLAFVVAISLSVLMIAKHFTPHYFTPTLVLKVFLIYLIAVVVIVHFKSKTPETLVPAIALAAGLLLTIPQFGPFASVVGIHRKNADMHEARRQILKKYENNGHPLIITSHYRGSPFRQSAMVGGYLLSGHLQSTYQDLLIKKYPDTYFYFDWTDAFYYWGEYRTAADFANVGQPLYIFIGEGKEGDLDIIRSRLSDAFPGQDLELVLLHEFHAPLEYFYEVTLGNGKPDLESKARGSGRSDREASRRD